MSDLDQRLAMVEGGGDELMHTPSVAADLAAGMNQGDAARAQRLREQVRIIDAELVEAKAQLMRDRLLRGPSGKRFVCDADCLLGGCAQEFAEEDGMLCTGSCQLFLCHKCFGESVVKNECQVGGRFEAPIENCADGGLMSASGSLPCPNYPSECSCAHIPIADIQRALLHPSNRGEDGPFEDIESEGFSPHRVFLMARRRQAETKLSRDQGEGASPRLRDSTLVRTVTEARQMSSALEGVIGLTRATSVKSGVRAALADKVDELHQLRDELDQLPNTAIPAGQRRLCAQCCGEFTKFEGAQCTPLHRNHFLCNVCFGGYLMKACARGGVFENDLKNDDGMVVSPAGKLPCPFFRCNPGQQIAVKPTTAHAAAAAAAEGRGGDAENPLANGQLPELDCHCGVIEYATIERVFLDPRNSSVSFWRERRASETIMIQAAASGVQVDQQATSGPWFWGMELLSRGWTPSSVHETARLRVNLRAEELEEQQRAGSPKQRGEIDSLADLHSAVTNALSRGASIQCPSCKTQATKDDACVHMDSCPCRASWCFLCGKLSGSQPGQCPRGPGGCDEVSYYLEQHPGWKHFNIGGESPAAGAREEFLRRRQAFYVRRVMEDTDPQLWAQLRQKSPTLLTDVPTPGREIGWDSLSTAEYPLFGANVGKTDISDIVDNETEGDDAAAERFRAHYQEEMQRAQHMLELERRRLVVERRQRRARCAWIVLSPIAVTSLVSWLSLTDFENPQIFQDPPIAPGLREFQNGTVPNSEVHDPVCTKDVAGVMAVPCECGISCDLLFWIPIGELALGSVLIAVAIIANCSDMRNDAGFLVCVTAVALVIGGWPLFLGPLQPWFVAYILDPLCSGAFATTFALLALLVVVDHDDDLSDRIVNILMMTASVIGFALREYLIWGARNFANDSADDSSNDAILAEYHCTASCTAIGWVTGGVAAVGCMCMTVEVYNRWDELKPAGVLDAIRKLLLLGFIVAAASWPLITEAATWASTAWLYPPLFATEVFLCISSYKTLENVWARRGNANGPWTLLDPLFFLLSRAVPLLACVLLYAFRSSIPAVEGENNIFSTVVDASFLFWIFFPVVLFMFMDILNAGAFDDFGDEFGPVATGFAGLAIPWAFIDGESLRQIWILICLMVLFMAFIGAVGLYCREVAGEFWRVPGWWVRCCGPPCGTVLFCFLVLLQNGLLGGAYYASESDEMPFAFVVDGATEEGLNGIYHLRIDLRDMISAECQDSWFECWWDRTTGGSAEKETELQGLVGFQELTLECLADMKGSYVYQAHSVEHPGFGPMLYRPLGVDNHAWVVAPLNFAYRSCFKSPAGFLHSIEKVCATRPDAVRRGASFFGDEITDCGQQWKEAVLPVTTDGTASTAVWRDAPSLTVTARNECVENDMCCLVGCEATGKGWRGTCTTQVRFGAPAGICNCTQTANGTQFSDDKACETASPWRVGKQDSDLVTTREAEKQGKAIILSVLICIVAVCATVALAFVLKTRRGFDDDDDDDDDDDFDDDDNDE